MHIQSKQGDSHVLLEMPHSGRVGLKNGECLPPLLKSLVRFESAEVRKTLGFGCDAAAAVLSGYERRLSLDPVSGVRNRIARAFMDCNRDATEVSGLAVSGAEKERFHHGVIWARTVLTGLDPDVMQDELQLAEAVNTKSEPVLRRPLTPEEFKELLRWGHEPYHAAVRAQHRRILARHGRCVHVALHTLPAFTVATSQGGYVCGPPAKRGPLDPRNGTLPDVILIHNGYAAASEHYVEAIRSAFVEDGLIVSDGTGPFLGSNGVTKMYGDPKNGMHVIGIEHVTHDGIEPRRHLGGTSVLRRQASRLQWTYDRAIKNLLDLR